MNIDFKELYSDICRTLTDYEGNGDPAYAGDPAPLYELLCEIQNALEENL